MILTGEADREGGGTSTEGKIGGCNDVTTYRED